MPHEREGTTRSPLNVIPQAALTLVDGKIVFAGPAAEASIPVDAKVVDLEGRAVVPGLVDSHTHAVFAGNRMDEMARRTRGETYEEIARAGGGIVRSVAALRQVTVAQLVEESRPRLLGMLARGTTTCEIKTGYGLEPELEKRQLAAIQVLTQEFAANSLFSTVLAHVIPPERRSNRAQYIEEFCSQVLEPAAREGTVQFCDVFVEPTAFSKEECRIIAQRAKQAGLKVKLHVDQLQEGHGGAELAAQLGALSADHLEKTSTLGAAALANANVMATVLPGCGLFLGAEPFPDGRALREAGCEVAVATDCNPGSSMVLDLALCGTLAATQCGLSLEEALWGMTRGGAKALGLADRGRLQVGERADFLVLNHPDWRSLLYNPGAAPIEAVYVLGEKQPR